ncbi:hypothetical protein CQZ99_21945 [Pseudomonas poae]|uniref:Uncharacterized protein n=1 Tax=Pseudomonas poae TaxID=200451 RepID=A0A2S9EDT2_9PSED|nr:hypothetical protein CQZ97_24340 [Pseudomonas poae]PRC13156.1 hypothetical protein CQZ99_21945 [Pseudomonas poae]
MQVRAMMGSGVGVGKVGEVGLWAMIERNCETLVLSAFGVLRQLSTVRVDSRWVGLGGLFWGGDSKFLTRSREQRS